MSELGKLSIVRMCQLAGVSRAGFYRWLQRQEPVEEELEVRSVIQQIIVEHKRRYGYRRVSAELRRRGLAVNHKRVARLMREDNLLAVQPKSFVITTDSEHALEVYLNLAKRMKLSGLNQLWIADITYVRLQREFVFLAVMLDTSSRQVGCWELARTLTARLPMAALEKAIEQRHPAPGLVHHSDRGVQYACGAYQDLLRKHAMTPSMKLLRFYQSLRQCRLRSFMKTLKREEVNANEYRDMDQLRENIAAFIDNYYNRVRLHSALGYAPPEEFEQTASSPASPPGASMSFSRAWGDLSIRCRIKDEEGAETGSPEHRLDESPAGYSLAGCSPAEPASASPTEIQSRAEEAV